MLDSIQAVHRQAALEALRRGDRRVCFSMLLESFLGRANLRDVALAAASILPGAVRRRAGKLYERVTGRHPAGQRVREGAEESNS